MAKGKKEDVGKWDMTEENVSQLNYMYMGAVIRDVIKQGKHGGWLVPEVIQAEGAGVV